MKTKSIFITVCTMVWLTSFTACGNNSSNSIDDECSGLAWDELVEEELEEFSDALTAYYANPTKTQCEIYEEATSDLVNALKDINVSCIDEASQQDYQQAIADAEEVIKDLDCSQLDNLGF